MLCRKFELIPMKIGFFYELLKLLKNRAKVPVSPKMARREFSIFIIFSDTHTCTYVALKV